jgi:hypothetical protein
MRTLNAAIALVMAGVMIVPASPASAAPVSSCGPRVHLAGVGNACRRSDGLYEVFAPRSGRSLGLTHGPDRNQKEPKVAAAPSSGSTTPVGQRPVVCAGPSDYHVELVYARAFDDADQYAARAEALRVTVERVNYWLNVAAQATGGGSADYKLRCTNGIVTVSNVVLPTAKSNDSFGSILEDLTAVGYTSARTKYLVLYDDSIPCGCGGIAQTPGDDRLASDNAALRGPVYAVTLSPSTLVMMHELSHTMGVVQNSAPHSTGGAHCYDGADVMCYNDGAPKGNLYTTSRCSGFVFDCNKDDYFNTKPSSSNYLATHWNLGSRLNRYFRFPPAPDTSRPVISILEPRTGNIYIDGCSSRSSITGTGRPAFHGRGCIRATATDVDTGVDRLDIYFDGKLVSTQWQLPTSALSFDLGRGPGIEIPLKLVATDFAEIPSGPNITTTTIFVDVV